jgi:hydroxymethylpyrimidine/phosphomethylpyrimidine kinase
MLKSLLLPMANLVTPNQFEAETLWGHAITSWKQAREAVDYLHDFGIEYVVITSITLPLSIAEDPVMEGESGSYLLASRRVDGKNVERFILPIAMVSGAF